MTTEKVLREYYAAYNAEDAENGVTEFENVLVARRDVSDFMGRAVRAGETIRFTMTGRYLVRDGRIVRPARVVTSTLR